MSDYELNDRDITLNIWISTGASAASFILCAAVLGAAAWVWSYPQFRMYLDRVSFRLLLWSMVFELAYDVSYIAVELYSIYNIQGGACGAGVYFMMAFMGVVNYLCTAIAVNLALTITFGMNPIRQRLERWYVGVSIFLGMFVPIVPAALGHFGYDPILSVCWITGKTDTQRMRYFILDLYLWQILSCVIATASVILVLITLIRQRRATSAALYAGNQLNRDLLASSDEEDYPAKGSGKRKRRSKYLWARLSSFSTSSTTSSSAGAAGPGRPHRMSHTMSQLEDRFLRIALKISSYPVALIIVNVVITVGDLIISRDGGVYSKSAYALYCVYYFLYGGRGIVFALLAFFIDPCLRFGLRAVLRAKSDPNRSIPGIELESSRIDTMERSFSEMLAMPDPPTNPSSYDDEQIGKRFRGMSGTPGRRAQSRPAALRFGRRGRLGDVEMGEKERGTQSLPDPAMGLGVAALDFDAPGWGGLGGVAAEKLGPASTGPTSTTQLAPVPSPLRRASSTSSVDALKEKARERRISSTSVDMPVALTQLAFEAEQKRPQAPHRSTSGSGAREVSPKGTAPTSPNLQPQRTSFHLPIMAPKAFSPRLGRLSFSSTKPSPMIGGSGEARRTSNSDPSSRVTSPSQQQQLGQYPHSQHTPSRSFVGVNIESLPAELTDNVDIDRHRPADHSSPTKRKESRVGFSPSLGPNIPGTADAQVKSSSTTPTSAMRPPRTPTPPTSASLCGSCVDVPQQPRRPSAMLDPLDPDLPNATEEAIRRIRAAREQRRQEKEAAIMAFLQTKAML